MSYTMLGSQAMYLEILLRDDLDETDTAALDSWYLSQPADLGIVIPILEGKLVNILQCQNMFKCLKYCNCKIKTISDYQSFTVNIMFSIKNTAILGYTLHVLTKIMLYGVLLDLFCLPTHIYIKIH